jgi:hypothetical protein
MYKIQLLLMMMVTSAYSLEIITGESFNGKDDLAGYEYGVKYLTGKELYDLIKIKESTNIAGDNYIAIAMTKNKNSGRVLMQFTCRIEGEGKNEVVTIYPAYTKVDETELIMVPTKFNKVDRIVITGCMLK